MIATKDIGTGKGALYEKIENAGRKRHIAYAELIWLYFVGSLLGVVIEGIYTYQRIGVWQDHVVSLTLPLCALYGLGAAGCYLGYRLLPHRQYLLHFVFFAFVGTALELAAGALLEFSLGMRAWNYSRKPFNFRGYICFSASIGWGVIGVVFSFLAGKPLDRMFSQPRSKLHKILTVLLWIYIVVDVLLTFACIFRWSCRHFHKPARTGFGRWIDRTFPDTFMKKRFCEWRFLK